MKHIKFILPFLSVVFFASCTEIHFEQPQPDGKKEILTIHRNFVGEYNYHDSSIKIDDDTAFIRIFPKKCGLPVLEINKLLVIYPKIVMTGYDGKFLFNKKQTEIVDEMGWNIDTIAKMFAVKKKLLKMKRTDGKLSFFYNEQDTLINISRGDVLKKYKGSLYLNKYNGTNDWVVYRITKKKNKLIFASLNNDDKDLLTSICPEKDDKNFAPTLKQFKLFLKKGGFQKKEEFSKK